MFQIPPDSVARAVRIGPPLSDAEPARLCAVHHRWRIERTREGVITINTPTGTLPGWLVEPGDDRVFVSGAAGGAPVLVDGDSIEERTPSKVLGLLCTNSGIGVTPSR